MPHCASTWRYKLLSEHAQENINPACMQDTVSWPPRAPKGPASPRADELVDPVRMTRSVPLSDCHPHRDLPHPQRVQIWGRERGEVTPLGWWQPPRTRYTMARCACAWGKKKQTCGGGVLGICLLGGVGCSREVTLCCRRRDEKVSRRVGCEGRRGGRIRIRAWSVFARERERGRE